MDFRTSFCVLLVLFVGLISSSQAYNFYVGGKDGWTINPYEKYNQWAERNRFLINDTLTFKYKNGSDSVLVVSKDDYYKCNTEKPILRMDGGDSVFKFDKSGPFFFISGNKSSCEKGQRLIVIVLSERHHPSSPPPISKIPASAPSGTTPVSPSDSPSAVTPTSSSPVYPPVYAPMPASWSPSPSPLASSPTPAMSPMSHSPAPWSSTPSITPATSPTSASPSPSKSSPAPASSSPVTSTPTLSPSKSSPAPASSSPVTGTPTPSQSETGGTPSDSTPAPSPAKASAPGLATPSALLMAAVVIVLSLTFGSN